LVTVQYAFYNVTLVQFWITWHNENKLNLICLQLLIFIKINQFITRWFVSVVVFWWAFNVVRRLLSTYDVSWRFLSTFDVVGRFFSDCRFLARNFFPAASFDWRCWYRCSWSRRDPKSKLTLNNTTILEMFFTMQSSSKFLSGKRFPLLTEPPFF
jgi:hypothetical protein